MKLGKVQSSRRTRARASLKIASALGYQRTRSGGSTSATRTVFLLMLDQGHDGVLGLMIPDRTKVKTDAAPDNNNSSVATLDEQIIRMLTEAEAIDARQQEKIEESRLGRMPKGPVRFHTKLDTAGEFPTLLGAS